MPIAQFRRLTAGMIAADELAARETIPLVTKREVSTALKKAAGALGITGTAYQVLDILLALSPSEDWGQHRRPVVAISNAKLAHNVGRSVRTVIRSLKLLVEAGIVAYRDSPTGRRFIYRDAHDNPVAAYGLDFSPARQRLSEFVAIGSEHRQRFEARREAERQSMATARRIVDLIEEKGRAGEPTKPWTQQLEGMMARFDEERGSTAFAAELEEMHRALVDKSQGAIHQESPEGDTDVTPILTTTQQHHIRTAPDERVLGRKPSRPLPKGTAIDIRMARAAFREMTDQMGIEFNSWHELIQQSGHIRRLVSIPDAAWNAGVEQAGVQIATIAAAITVEKSLRNVEIRKPQRYFLGMTFKAPKGELHLGKTLTALARA